MAAERSEAPLSWSSAFWLTDTTKSLEKEISDIFADMFKPYIWSIKSSHFLTLQTYRLA